MRLFILFVVNHKLYIYSYISYPTNLVFRWQCLYAMTSPITEAFLPRESEALVMDFLHLI